MSAAATRILGTGHYVPPRVVTNDELATIFDTNDEWIRQRSGVEQRRYAGPDDPPAAMGEKAARLAITDAGLEVADIDLIVLATLSPDLFFPGSACLVQARLGRVGIPALDIRTQCTGLLYAIATADAWIRAGLASRVLVIGTEVHSSGLDFSDEGRDVTVLFGDGAAAMILGPTDRPDRGFLAHCLHADGRGAQDLMVPAPGTSFFPRQLPDHARAERLVFPQMNGRAVFKQACTRLPEVIMETLAKAGYKLEDVDLLVPHQANLRINEWVAKELGLPMTRVVSNIQRYGNTTAASIGIALDEARKDGRIHEGSLVQLAAFGSGFTWASSLVRF